MASLVQERENWLVTTASGIPRDCHTRAQYQCLLACDISSAMLFLVGGKIASYYTKVSGIPGGNKLIKTIYPYMRAYDILTCEDIVFDNISLLSLQLHLNLLVYDRSIFGSSSVVLGNLRKMFGNVLLALGTILENLRKSSENRLKRRHQDVYIIQRLRKNITR